MGKHRLDLRNRRGDKARKFIAFHIVEPDNEVMRAELRKREAQVISYKADGSGWPSLFQQGERFWRSVDPQFEHARVPA